jgi:hypothetical protein
MGLTDEQVDSIIEMHSETVDGLKADMDKLKADAKDLADLQKELERAQADLETAKKDGFKDKYDLLKEEYDNYKNEQTSKETKAAKEKAVREYLESKNIKDGNLKIAMRGLAGEIDRAELGEDGLKDTSELDALIAGDLSGLVTTTTEVGAPPPANPMTNTGGKMTKEQIMGIKDRTERRAAIAANLDLFESKGE